MPRYYYDIKDQTNWPESIVLIQIFGAEQGEEQTAIIRSSVGNFVSPEFFLVEEALLLAEAFRLNNMLDSVGVHLGHGAAWDTSWGELVDQKGLGLP